MDGGGRSNLQPPFVRDYPPARDNLPPPLTNEFADVMLANPPFMTPRGGIKPHGLFRVSAKRAEVLFVDYIASHLNEHGRAGIIVPEGIIFQSQNAYKQLRRLLVEESLVAVISLPGGVFKPYSGVKTSILILDRVLAQKTDYIAFFKVENDGYDLGDQRRSINEDDLPTVAAEISEYLRRIRAEESLDDFAPQTGLVVEKGRITADGDYNLGGERFRGNTLGKTQFPYVSLGELSDKPKYGSGASKAEFDGRVRYVRITDITDNGRLKDHDLVSPSDIDAQYFLEPNDLLVARSGSVGRAYLHKATFIVHQYAGYLIRFRIDPTIALPEYVYQVTKSRAWAQWITENSKIGTISNINAKQYSGFTFPLPPLEVQRELVAEIEGYQRVLDGARAVVDNWQPRIVVDPEWPEAGIADLVADIPHSIKAGPFGSSLKKDSYVNAGYKIYGQEQVIRGDANFGNYYIDEGKFRELESCKVRTGDVLVSLVGTYGKTLIVPDEHEPGIINPRLIKITLDHQKMIPEFLGYLFTQDFFVSQMHALSHGGTMNILGMQTLKRLRIPLPPLDTQRIIVAELDEEQGAVSEAERLAAKMEQRIQNTIARVWES